MTRLGGTLLCAAAHLALAALICFLFPFLMGGPVPSDEAAAWWWARDAALVALFGVSHSLLLAPPVRKRLERFLPGPLHGCLFTLVTSTVLLLLVFAWQASPVVVWRLDGWAALAMNGLYLLSWAALFYSLSLSGFGWQTGWTPYWAWVRGQQPPRRRFEERGVYRLLRHPTYLSFLGIVWFTPVVTLDRAVLIGLMTAYVAVGSCLKDRRMILFMGDVYRRYQSRVPGYPLIGFGPLGRVPMSGEAEVTSAGR